ncbi:aminotransferase class IV, partial [Methylophaga sp. UBA5088]
GRGYKPPLDALPQRIIASHPLPDYPTHYSEGVTVQLCSIRLSSNPLLAGIKHLNRLEQVLARNEWSTDAIAEGLMLDYQDRLVEGTMSNLFLVKDEHLLTPNLNESGIEGIMRQRVIELASVLNIPTEITTLN